MCCREELNILKCIKSHFRHSPVNNIIYNLLAGMLRYTVSIFGVRLAERRLSEINRNGLEKNRRSTQSRQNVVA